MIEPLIKVQHRGRLANKMFQAMLALELNRKVPNAKIAGLDLPEWGVVSPPDHLTEHKRLIVKGHKFNLDEIAWLLNNGAIETVELDVWAQRLSYYRSPPHYRSLFKPRVEPREIADDQLLVNIRGEDILTGWHSRYYPLPFSYYDQIIEQTGLSPVFMGQIGDDEYSTSLRKRYHRATILPSRGVLEDFETLRNARHIVLSISTFSWLSTWLSPRAVSIHLPVAGIFNPAISNSLLLPVNDPRYHFYNVAIPPKNERINLDLLDWASRPQPYHCYTEAEIKALLRRAMLKKPESSAQPGQIRL